jgi:hypothetical protein
MAIRLTWRGPQVGEELIRILTAALDRHNLKIEAHAKAELYPGHGKVTGTLQRSIGATPSRREGRRIVGSVSTKGVSYARLMHRRYQYLRIGALKAGTVRL